MRLEPTGGGATCRPTAGQISGAFAVPGDPRIRALGLLCDRNRRRQWGNECLWWMHTLLYSDASPGLCISRCLLETTAEPKSRIGSPASAKQMRGSRGLAIIFFLVRSPYITRWKFWKTPYYFLTRYPIRHEYLCISGVCTVAFVPLNDRKTPWNLVSHPHIQHLRLWFLPHPQSGRVRMRSDKTMLTAWAHECW